MDEFDINNYAPVTAASYNDVTGRYDRPWIVRKFGDIFLEGKKQDDAKYQAYLDNLQATNDWRATQAAYAYDKYMSDTQVQRLVEDIKKAGLNPWLAVQNGLSTSGASSAQKANYSYKGHKSADSSGSDIGRNLALILLATARMLTIKK